MKKLLVISLLSLVALVGCANHQQAPVDPVDPVDPADPVDPVDPVDPEPSLSFTVDYLSAAEFLPTSWNDEDTAETVRSAQFTVGESEFNMDFLGKWYISSNQQELQAKKNPVSFVRSSTSDLIPSKVVIETFKADIKVYLTNDCSGEEVAGKAVDAVHSDGTALEYTLGGADWSFLAAETYKGSSINIYSFTFYF